MSLVRFYNGISGAKGPSSPLPLPQPSRPVWGRHYGNVAFLSEEEAKEEGREMMPQRPRPVSMLELRSALRRC